MISLSLSSSSVPEQINEHYPRNTGYSQQYNMLRFTIAWMSRQLKGKYTVMLITESKSHSTAEKGAAYRE